MGVGICHGGGFVQAWVCVLCFVVGLVVSHVFGWLWFWVVLSLCVGYCVVVDWSTASGLVLSLFYSWCLSCLGLLVYCVVFVFLV